MEWTDSALSELDRIVHQIRSSLNPVDVDVEEVAEDIQRRIEEELTTTGAAVITEVNVRNAAARIGVDEIGKGERRDSMSEELERSLSKPLRMRSRFASGFFWFIGIILPLLALGTELITRICLDSGLPDPLPTPVHALLIAVVPLFNLLAWRAVHGRKSIDLKWLGLLGGIALITAIYNTILFATITPFAFLGFAAIIYFGIGLICFLPLSPLLSLCATAAMLLRLKKQRESATRKLPWLGRGAIAGLAVLVASSAPMYLTKAALSMAASESEETTAQGLRILRKYGDETLMNRACYQGANAPNDLISWAVTSGSRVSPQQAREIYYRVTGESFHSKAAPTLGFRNRRNPGDEFDWDPELGGDIVAGRLKGLSLSDSRMDGTVDPDAATAYMEWTMVFRNEWRREREARAQIALPPGAVVSRLTLWIDGEEREAAFGGRSQVKQAYKKVVRRRRDPVLVTTCGPDRVLMQCYPVPAGGEMKVRVGITAPLALHAETERTLKLPRFLERNFRIPEKVAHAVWIGDLLRDDLTDTELNDPARIIRVKSDVLTASCPMDDRFVVQTIQERAHPPVGKLAVVIDSSACMKGHIETVANAIGQLPSGMDAIIYVADDEPRTVDRPGIRAIGAEGGKDNCSALREALMLPGVSQVVWIHGPQAWSFDACEKIRQVMERDRSKRIFAYQIGHGPHRLVEKMDNLAGFKSIPATADPGEDLARLFASFAKNVTTLEADRVPANQTDPAIHQANDHLLRLFIWDQIKADLNDGDSDTSEALELALKYHLVTPVSGAVVLETQKQYDEANLKPVNSADVPNVPEPGSLVLIILAALLMFYGHRIVQLIKSKLTV